MNSSSESNHVSTVSAFVSSRELFKAAYKQQGQLVTADKSTNFPPFFDLSVNKGDILSWTVLKSNLLSQDQRLCEDKPTCAGQVVAHSNNVQPAVYFIAASIR